MRSDSGPLPLARALADLIALRGYARSRGNADLQSAWQAAAGEAIGRQTRAVAIRRGVLHVGVAHAPLLSELVGFHRQTLLAELQSRFPHLKIRDVKFKLDSGVGPAAER